MAERRGESGGATTILCRHDAGKRVTGFVPTDWLPLSEFIMSQDINEAYDGEISGYLMHARGYIAAANAISCLNKNTREDQRSLAIIGMANALLAAVIMLVKETPP